MRRLRLIKVVVPEIVAYFGVTPETKRPDYRCTECGCGVDKVYVCCPYCGSEFDWDKVKKPSQRFLRVLKRLQQFGGQDG